MKTNEFQFEKLHVYALARDLVKEVYLLVKSFPKEEKYALSSQIRRSITSVVANIAEGNSRTSMKEKIHFVEISYGSLLEALSELQIAEDLDFIAKRSLDSLKPKFAEVAKMLSGLRKTLEKNSNL